MTSGIEDPAYDKLEIVYPNITLLDFKGYWVGLGAAIEWIAMRGKEMTLAEFETRFDEGTEELVRLLADLPDDEASRVVRGENVAERGPLASVPSGLWRQTATSDANDAGRLYRLIGTDDDDEWEGAILSAHHGGFRKVQVSSDFILANWPQASLRKVPTPRAAVSEARLRRLIRSIVEVTPLELAPLRFDEIKLLVKSILPNATRSMIRKDFRLLVPAMRSGPLGPRDPNRKSVLEEFRQKILSTELQN